MRLDVHRFSGDAEGTDNPVTITIDDSMSVTATFTINYMSIGGYIREPDGNTPVAGVVVDANSNGGSIDVTDANGYYEVMVPYNWSGTVMPIKEGYTFEPNGILYNNVITDDATIILRRCLRLLSPVILLFRLQIRRLLM